MKSFSTLFFCSFLLLSSCSKDEEPAKKASMRFKANGVQYQWSGDWHLWIYNEMGVGVVHKLSGSYGKYYFLSGFDIIGNKNNSVEYEITKDSVLQLREYRFPTDRYLGRVSATFPLDTIVQLYINTEQPGDYSSVTITKIENGLVSGKFEGRQTGHWEPEKKMVIEDGVFENLKIIDEP